MRFPKVSIDPLKVRIENISGSIFLCLSCLGKPLLINTQKEVEKLKKNL